MSYFDLDLPLILKNVNRQVAAADKPRVPRVSLWPPRALAAVRPVIDIPNGAVWQILGEYGIRLTRGFVTHFVYLGAIER